ncbi:MAG: hypothetical protein H0T89_04430 [Deltaproteobacteria bacterium]|nr:hypothetical protein [Deltaproteobacteria bacterium]MDQ3301371.1 hypothetical protein [Myxococcota bacterium]
MATDDDILTSPVPEPDAEPTAAERAHAKTFADLVDKTLSGRTPAAMSADDRALLEVATVIRVTSGGLPLSPGKQRSIVEDVLASALGGAARGPSGSLPGVTPITAARGRARRVAPWAIAGISTLVAAAAVALLWLRAPTPATPVAHPPSAPTAWLSRPADPMIGPISRERAGDASARLDYIFADRLDGYRARRLTGSAGTAGKPRGGKR